MIAVALILLLILLNGLFALAEIAVVSSRASRLQTLSDEDRPGAKAALAVAQVLISRAPETMPATPLPDTARPDPVAPRAGGGALNARRRPEMP